VIVGEGVAGLSLTHCLEEAGIDHVMLKRGLKAYKELPIVVIISLCIWLLSLIQIRFTPNRILVQLSSKSIATKSASQMTTVRYPALRTLSYQLK
jgi:hypothetical protein